MSSLTRTQFKIGFLAALLLAQGMLAHATPDDPGYVIRLSGIPAPYSFERVCALRSGDLWLVGGDGEIQHISGDGTVKKAPILNADLNGVFFSNADSGWVVGNLGSIAHTEDGGLTWETQTSGVRESLQAITCTDKNRCWAVGEKGIILTTKDRGNRWKIVRSGLFTRLFAVSFVNHQTGWAVGEDGFIAHTTDAGESWSKQRATIVLFPDGPFATPTDLLAVRFVDEKRGWVAGAGGIARTVDGGKTWEAKEIEDNAFIGLVSNDGKTVWAVSREGTNYMTKDGGFTWALANSEKVSAKRKSACTR